MSATVLERTGRKGHYYWRAIAENGRILSGSTESYARRIDMRKAMRLTAEAIMRWLAKDDPGTFRRIVSEITGQEA